MYIASSLCIISLNVLWLQNTTFQGILITDGSVSYAVFIYECGGMGWGGATIGWQANSSDYQSHPLSGKSDNNKIGCLYSDAYSAVVYHLSECIIYCEHSCIKD